MTTDHNTLDHHRQARAILIGVILVVLISLFFGISSLLRFKDAQTAWENHNARATAIADAIAAFNRHTGYGGFIHDFKNLVLRRDLSRYQEKIEANIVGFRVQLDQLDALLNTDEDKAAIAQIRATFEEYAANYAKVHPMVSTGAGSDKIDAMVKVSDGPALTALARLSARVAERAKEAEQQAQRTHADALRFGWLGGTLVITAIIAALGSMMMFLRRIVAANEIIRKTQAQLDELLDTAPDAMLSVARDGRIVRANQMAEHLFGHPHAELLAMSVEQLIPEVSCAGYFADATPRLMGTGLPLVALTKDRREPSIEISRSHSGEGAEQLATITIRDVTEREENQRALIAAREAADRANLAKSDFLSSMSHELRTPMNAILGFAQILEFDNELSADQKDNVHEIHKAGHHLLHLINEVLDLAKVESGRIELSMEGIDLPTLGEDCRHLIQPIADQAGIVLHFDLPAEIAVFADRVRIKQVLLNLLSNAVKYNQPGGSVRLTAATDKPGHLRIAVTDSGPGIKPERLGDLFQPFNRLGAEASEVEGTGIGLTITHRLVHLMGGDMGVESTLGVGSTFWLELAVGHTAIVGAGKTECPEAGTAAASINANDLPQREARVLAIDDNPSNLKLIA